MRAVCHALVLAGTVLMFSSCWAQGGAVVQEMGPGAALPAPDALTGVWEGEVFFTSVRADLVQDSTVVNGMAYPFTGVVTMGSGERAVTYHVNGFINNTGMVGMHPPSNAQFLGKLRTPDEIRGSIVLKSGQEIPLTAVRQH